MDNGFEVDPDRVEELGAPVADVAQEAIDAAAATYANEPEIDVEEHLDAQLRSRGLRAETSAIAEIARRIRSGHAVVIGRPDGSLEE